ncbi:cadherin domain-containing protein [Candidatus Poribacteria bacterium]|nr:cadherin domain-containing protein [Candidatus Poribacteria bacterium]
MGTHIGGVVTATDIDGDGLLYSLGGIDSDSFRIDSSTGQLISNSSLDYEQKSIYSVLVTVFDDKGGSDSISVTILVTDIFENHVPSFLEGLSTSRTIAENSIPGIKIGNPVSAEDPDNDLLTYILRGVDVDSFDINSSTGQLLTKSQLDFESKSIYSVTITVADGRQATDIITVSIIVTDINESVTNKAPVFNEGETTERSIPENSVQNTPIGNPVSASDDEDDVLTYSLGGIDASSFTIDFQSGQLRTQANLDFEDKSVYMVVISVTDNYQSDSITVTITVSNTNDPPTFLDTIATTREIPENTVSGVNIGPPVSAIDRENNTLTYSLDVSSKEFFEVISTTGQLRTKKSFDYESDKTQYTVLLSVTDGVGGNASIELIIKVTNVNDSPVITVVEPITYRIEENSSANLNIGNPISAIDQDNITLEYTLDTGDGSSFIIDDSGQLKTKSPLDYETKSLYSVIVTVSDSIGASDSVLVSIEVIDVLEIPVNSPPVFTDGSATTRSIEENSVSNTDIGNPIAATDVNADTLIYELSGPDVLSFDFDTSNGQIITKTPLDYEDKDSYTLIVTVNDNNGGTDSIDVLISITDVNEAPVIEFTDPIAHSVPENTISNTNIGDPITVTDQDDDPISYSLSGTDNTSFIIDSQGQLKTSSPLDFETKDTYAFTIDVSDNQGGTDSIDAVITITDINDAPIFNVTTPITYSIPENTAANIAIGAPVTATDQDDDNLSYLLDSGDGLTFSIDHVGQLKTSEPLDYETKSTYIVTITVDDGEGGTSRINVSINIDNVEPEATLLSNRTQQVIDAIVDAIPDITDSADVTETHLSSITTLDISSEYITSLDASDFDGLTSLETLNLHSNSLETLPIGLFSGLTSLTTLDLCSNKISSLQAETLNGLSTLTSLNLSGNEFDSLPNGVFDGLTSLRSLDISGNDVESLPSDIFDELSMLKTLNLCNMGLTSLPADIFDELASLEKLYLCSNELSSLPLGLFDELTSLELLDLNTNSLSSFSSTLFDQLSSLTTLDFGKNSFTSFPAAVAGLTSVISLNLSGNQLGSLTTGMFNGLTSLTILGLADNGLSSLPNNFFNGLSGLTSLDLSSNEFVSFGDEPFSDLSALTHLNLSNNQISSLSDGFFVGLSSLTSFTIAGNNPPIHENFTIPFFILLPEIVKVEEGKFKAFIRTGTPYTMNVSIDVVGGVTSDFVYTVVIPAGSKESNIHTVVRSNNTATNAVGVNIDYLIGGPITHIGYAIFYTQTPVEVLSAANAPKNIDITPTAIPPNTALLANYPNPFNPETWIPFQLNNSANVSFTIYNLSGELIRHLKLGVLDPGYYLNREKAAYWDGRNQNGEKVATGIYFCKFKTNDYSSIIRLIIHK